MREAETPQIPSETGNRARRAIEKKKKRETSEESGAACVTRAPKSILGEQGGASGGLRLGAKFIY